MIMSVGIRRIFTEVAPTYEQLNHLLTFGMDILWRDKTAKIATGSDATLILDVCSGTGELAIAMTKYAQQKTRIIASDLSIPMVSLAVRKNVTAPIEYLFAETKTLPIRNNVFDVVTLSFATRNLNAQPGALSPYFMEFHRVIKPGGRFVNLETSQPSFKPLQILFHAYAHFIIKRVGILLSRSKAGYAFLSHTITRFHTAKTIANLLKQAGFAAVKYTLQFGGITAIHIAQKTKDK
jgi:demethylmenaquinone methyltransferase/2-methoxy-6-polyprenyl-1,4-benzoquinol methylase